MANSINDEIVRSLSASYINKPLMITPNLAPKLSPEKLKKLKALQAQKKKLLLQKEIKDNFDNFKFNLSRKIYHFVGSNTNPLQQHYEQLFPNQKQFGNTIFNNYVDNLSLIHTLAVAPTQSGKTGSMLSIMYHALSHKTHGVPIENIFIFTAHSSREWLLQTRDRFPSVLHDNIFHRNNLKKIIQKLKNKSNVLLIIDEAHIGVKISQTLFNLFYELNYYNFTHLFNNNIKIVNFTATPNLIIQNFELWKQSATVVNMPVPESYISHDKLLKTNRAFQFKDLTCFDSASNSVNPVAYENIREILPFVYNMKSPKYHIIRTPRANLHDITIQNFKNVIKDDFLFISETIIPDLDHLIASPPDKHTFIFIKDKLRCAKTLHKHHLGVLYERFVHKPNHDSIIQGLAGRLTGYHNNTHSVVFSHLPLFYSPSISKPIPSAFIPF